MFQCGLPQNAVQKHIELGGMREFQGESKFAYRFPLDDYSSGKIWIFFYCFTQRSEN